MKKAIYIFCGMFLLLQGCLNEPDENSAINMASDFSSKVMTYLEQQGYYRISSGNPHLITSYQLMDSINCYIIVDIRNESDYLSGHIENSINISPENLIEFFQNEVNSIKNYVLVSKSGQMASYIECLLGIYGFSNLYTLKFGMASWNSTFAEEWLNNTNTLNNVPDRPLINDYVERNEITSLPNLESSSTTNFQEYVQSKIAELMANAELDDNTFESNTNPFISIDDLYSRYDYVQNSFTNTHVICNDIENAYRLYGNKSTDTPGHPPRATWFPSPISTSYQVKWYIQRIPSEKLIVSYSTDGHTSAFLTAYLRLLGYKAKSMKYGINCFGYNKMLYHEDNRIRENAFSHDKIGEFSFITN